MRYSNEGLFQRQFSFLKQQFLQDGDRSFTDVLSHETVQEALDTIEVAWNERIYTPLVTLWIFLGQVISADHSCRAAVARFVAHRVSRGQNACSSHTGACCQARKRLPEKFFSCIARQVGRSLNDKVDAKWLWKGRHVLMFDGTTVSMPDTPESQAEYPQVYNQKPGLGFPIARVCTIISLSCGAVLDLGICRYAGKGQGEASQLRNLWDMLSPGDVLLTDALMSSWYEMLTLKQRGIDSVSRINKARRRADFRRGKRLGKGDHIIRLKKPNPIRHIDPAVYKKLPAFLEIREVLVRVEQPGFRTRKLVVVTTILDPEAASKEDLASLYRSRWSQELDLRDIKISLQMDILRCKTPELVRKEIWTDVLAFNLVRTVMAQAATHAGIQPREISFKGTVQLLQAFQPLVSFQTNAAVRQAIYRQLLAAVASHRVADRPDRFEPRQRKRYPRKAEPMRKPRCELKRLMRKGVTKI